MPAYEITTDPTRFDVDAIHAFLSASYWSPGIPRATVARAIANSVCFGVLHEGHQVGFARVITDKATFAYLADVYILEAHRGQGLVHRLMAALKRHQDLKACGACCWRPGMHTVCTPNTASSHWVRPTG
jgi:GNAT superfamily N-acetyltransferase